LHGREFTNRSAYVLRDSSSLQENILTNIGLTFTTFFVFAGIWDDRGKLLKWYTKGLHFDYRPAPLFTWIGCFWSILMTLGFPLVLMTIRKVSVGARVFSFAEALTAQAYYCGRNRCSRLWRYANSSDRHCNLEETPTTMFPWR
jgi:hypothetical protein